MTTVLFATDRGRPSMARVALWQARAARLSGDSRSASSWRASAARYRAAGR